MTRIVLIVILASIACGAPALSEPAQESMPAYTRPVILYPAVHNQSKRPAHAAFRYRKGGRCHHYHYYKPVVPDC
jgi:hypothetical protein